MESNSKNFTWNLQIKMNAYYATLGFALILTIISTAML